MTSNKKDNQKKNDSIIKTIFGKITLNSIKVIIIYILLAVAWVGIAPAWYEWFSGEKNADFCKWLYTLLDGNIWVNIPLCLVILDGSRKLCIKIWRDRDIRIYRPLLVAFIVFVLYWNSNVIYARIIGIHYANVFGTSYANMIGSIDYRMYCMVLLVLLFLIMIIKVFVIIFRFRKLFSKRQINDGTMGFDNDNVDILDIPDSLLNYASEIVNQLLHTDTKNGSFAVGITGGWGTGKSTFLAALKKQIGKQGNIVEFNPWLCRTPEQVTSDFFATLQRKLSSRYSFLSNSIKEYAKYINALPISSNPLVSLGLKYIDKQDSLYGLKQTLSAKFSKLDSPVFVFIDDIDRLERNEIFEVLRLIRNTADLSNIYYLVALDKEYVISVLDNSQITDPAAYLEKIFQIEIPMPKSQDYEILDTLLEGMKLHNGKFEKIFNPIGFQFDEMDQMIILKVFKTFREAKRFARIYLLNSSYLINTLKEDFFPSQVFWLELLKAYDRPIFDDIFIHPKKYLFLILDNKKYCLRSGILNDDQLDMINRKYKVSEGDNYNWKDAVISIQKNSEPYSGEQNWREETPLILSKLFLFTSLFYSQNRSIDNPENFNKFFTLSLSRYSLSRKELLSILDSGHSWLRASFWLYRDITPQSVLNQFESIDIKNLSDLQLKNFYLVSIFYVSIIEEDIYILSGFKSLLYNSNITNELKEKIQKFVLENITLLIDIYKNNPHFYIGFCRFLNSLYGSDKYVISNKDILEALTDIIKVCLKNIDLNVASLFNPSGEFGRIFRYCCIRTGAQQENGEEYKNIAADLIVTHFEKKEKKLSIEEFDNAYNNMSLKGILILHDNTKEEIYLSDAKYQEKARILYFGSNYKEFIEKLKKKCCS